MQEAATLERAGAAVSIACMASRPARGSRTPTILLFGGLAIFLVAMAWLIASSLTPRRERTFAPLAPGARAGDGVGTDTLTVDARDEHEWRYVDLDRGRVASPPDTAGWDLAVRRFHIVTSGGAARLGALDFDRAAVPSASAFVETARGRDTVNAAFERWYDYRMLSHTLRSRGEVYAVRSSEGRVAKLQLIGYYCPGMEAGCLTLRYAFLDPPRRVR